MPRVANANEVGNGPLAWYESIPPVTRFYGTIIFVLGALQSFKMINAFWLALIWQRVYTHFEVWRLVTNFFFGGKFSFTLLFRLIWVVTYGKVLETQTFQFQPADFVFMLIFGAVCTLVISWLLLVTMSLPVYFNADALIFMLLYVWARNFPDQMLSIYGLFTLQSFYLPFFYIALDYLMGGVPVGGLIGIAVGHLYYYLYDLLPAIGGPRLLVTPTFLKNLLADWGVGRRQNTSGGTGSFQGRGRRLGTN